MIKDYLLIVDQLNKKFDEFKQLVNHEIEEIEALAKFPLTPQQESIMFYIIRHQPVKAKQIASYLNVSKSAISQVLLKLENQHLITREKNNENRRESLISLGSRGEEYAQLLKSTDEMLVRKYYSKVRLEELNNVLQTLNKLLESVKQDRENKKEGVNHEKQ